MDDLLCCGFSCWRTFFSQAIAGDIAKGLTRILVTHHVHFLARCDKVIVMKKGRIAHEGSYEQLIAQGVDFQGAVDVSKLQGATSIPIEDKLDAKEKSIVIAKPEKDETIAELKEKADMKMKGQNLVKEEEREEGNVSGSAVHSLCSLWRLGVVISVLFIQGFGRGAEIMASFWLALWAGQAKSAMISGVPQTSGETNFYLGIYALFGPRCAWLDFRSIMMAVHRLGASKRAL
jgi:hypothetical protein